MVSKGIMRPREETVLGSRVSASRLFTSFGAVGLGRRAGVVGVVVLVGAVLWLASPVWGQSAAGPEITSTGPFAVAEGATAVTTLTATDSDPGPGDLVWSLAGEVDDAGEDTAAFTLGESGVLAFSSAKDYESFDDADGDGVYELTVRVSDGTNEDLADLEVILSNVVELTEVTGPSTVTFAENDWSRVATFSASSSQDSDGVVWVLSGADAARFSMDDPLGALRFSLDAVEPVVFSKPPDFEAPVDSDGDNVYEVTVQPTTASDSTATPVVVTVTVTDADEAGTLALSTKRPRTGVEITAVLSDPDTVVDGSQVWVWQRSVGYNEWAAIAGADSSSYTPVAADAGSFLQVSVTYSDNHSSTAQARATAPEVVAADQLSALSVSTNDSVASTGTDEWRRMRPAFSAETLHYSVGCNNTDTMTLTLSAADASSRISIDGTQHANPGAGNSLMATRAVTGSRVVRIALTDAEGAQTQYVVHCLPDAFGEVTMEKPLGEDGVLDELILFPLGDRLVIMDSNGVPRVQRSVNQNGRFYFRFYPDVNGEPRYSYTSGGGRVLNENLRQIAVARTVSPLTRQDYHDFRVLDNGNYMLMAYQDTERDLSHLTFPAEAGEPYGSDVYVEDSVIQIVTPGEQAVFNWNSWDHMPLEDCVQHFFPPDDGDYAHLNATHMVDGHIIASMRGCSRVLAIDVATGDVVWRVGPSNLSDAEWAERDIGPAPLDIVGDPEGQFCGQHGTSLAPNGNLILYDNGAQCPINPWTRQNLLRVSDEFSRGVEYTLDLDNGEAVFVRDHSLHGTRSEIGYRGGNIESLSNGHWLISWGNSRGRNPQNDPPSETMTQVDPDTGEEWLHLGGSGAGVGNLRGTVMRPEALAEAPEPLEARVLAGSYTSVFHSGVGDAPTVAVVFNRPVADFGVSTPSLGVVGASVSAVAPLLVAGEPANTYLVTLDPDGDGAIRVSVVAGRGCDVGGVCAADGTELSEVPSALVIGPSVTVSFGAAAYSVGEGARLQVPVVLSSAHGGGAEIEVPITGSGLSAAVDDFSAAAEVSFAAGETRKTVSFDAADDALVEGPETVELSFGALVPGFSAGPTAVATVTITDTDTAAIEFSVASSEVSEGGETELTFAVTNGVTFADDQIITIEAVSGSAAAGVDFVLEDSNGPLSAPYAVTLEAGESSVTATLKAVDDPDDELAETVVLTATLASTSTRIGSRTVTIPASDLGVPEVTIVAGGAVNEGADAVFTLHRTVVVGSPLTVPLTVGVQVNATGEVLDGVAASTVTFPADNSSVELRVATVDDTVVEDTATVRARVLASNSATYEPGAVNSAAVTVFNDDDASFSVTASATRLVEGDTATVTVRTGGVTFAQPQTLTVDITGSAVVDDDFVLADGQGQQLVSPYGLVLAAGADSVTLELRAVTDDVDDNAETVELLVRHDGQNIGAVTITIVEVNQPPVLAGPNRLWFAENGTAAVATFTATDPEADTITWSLTGADATWFSITAGELQFLAPPDFEQAADTGADNVYDVTVRAADDEGAAAERPVKVTVTDIDEAATITNSGSFTFSHTENSAEVVAVFTAEDPENAPISWSLAGTDSDDFEISDHGVLTFTRPPDYEHPSDDNNNNEYLLEVWARAGASDPITQGVTVTVNDADEDAIVVLSSSQPQIGTPLQATITDPDGVLAVSTWTWQQSMDRISWTDIAVGASYTPADAGYYLQAVATYIDGFDVNIDNATTSAAHPTRTAPSTNNAPQFTANSLDRTVAENSTARTAVGAPVTASDADAGDRAKLAYTLSGSDAALFSIDAATGQIRVGSTTVLDFEAAVTSYSVTVTATDPSGTSANAAVAIEVIDANEPPAPAHDSATTSEDAAVTITVLDNDTDPDNDTLTVTVRDTPLHGQVRVQADKTLLYTPRSDFNGKDIFTYTASDGRLTNQAIVTITVSPVNDQPKFSTPTVQLQVPDGAQPGTPVGSPVTANDIDGETLRYGLFEADSQFFTIDADTGQIKVAPDTTIDRTTQTRYQMRIEATDPHNARVRTLINITVTTTGSGGGGGGGGGGGTPTGDGEDEESEEDGEGEDGEGEDGEDEDGEDEDGEDEDGEGEDGEDEEVAPQPEVVVGVEISGPAFAAPHTESVFTVTDTTGLQTLSWTATGPDDFTASSDGEQFALTTPTGGAYTITVTATDPNSDTHTATTTLSVLGDITGHQFADEIIWLAEQGITRGCSQQPLRYCPENPVTRAQMATFLTRALNLQTPQQPAGFQDINPASTHAVSIEALYATQITQGCSQQPLRYCPQNPVTRAQMATFLTRALNLQTPQQPAGFQDVDPASTHAVSIEALYATQITQGCSQQPLRYCPQDPVTRAQMAAFLYRARHLIAAASSN